MFKIRQPSEYQSTRAKSQSVGALTVDIREQEVSVVWDESVVESGQMKREIVALLLVI